MNPVSFSYCSPIVLLLFSYRSPIVLLLFSYRSPIVLLLFSYRSPIVLLSFSYSRTENDRRTIGGWTKNNGRCIDYTSVLKRRDSETQKGNQQCGMERKTNKWGSAEQGGSISRTMNPKTEIIKKTSDKVKRGLSVVNELRFHLSLVTIESLKNALFLSLGSKFYNLYD